MVTVGEKFKLKDNKTYVVTKIRKSYGDVLIYEYCSEELYDENSHLVCRAFCYFPQINKET